jgi:hypothetical protein
MSLACNGYISGVDQLLHAKWAGVYGDL